MPGISINISTQSQDYYPFGMTFNSTSTSDNKYLYNGKEMQEETDWLDYGARMYDGQLGRWWVVDPMADQRSWVSPYNYCQNDPIIRTDPTGALDWIPPTDGSGNWTAELGDGYWKLSQQAGIPLEDAKNAVITANQTRDQTRTSETMVYPGDKVTIPGSNTSGNETGHEPLDLTSTTNSSTTGTSSASSTGSAGGGDGWVFGQSIDITLATPGGGYNIEGGWFLGDNGKRGSQFVSHGVAYGGEASAGWNFIFINQKNNFKFGDLEGIGASWTLNIWMFSISVFGNSSPGYPENSVFDTYKGYKISIGAGIGGSAAPNSNTTFQNWMPTDIQYMNFHWH